MKSLEVKVGVFVLICAVILGATVYYVSYVRFKGARVPFRTYFRDANGIAAGTQVLFGGITAGKVTSVQPDHVDPTRIEILFDVSQGTPLNAKSVAQVGSVTLMSDPVLMISTGTNDASRLKAGAVVRSQEAVSLDALQGKLATLADSAQGTLVEVRSDLNNITGDARHLLANLNDATGDANRKHLQHILANADTMIAQLSPQVDQLTKDANNAVDNMNATVLNANETITAIRDPTRTDLVELQKTLEQTRGLLNDIQTLIRVNSQNTTYTIENLRMATDNLNDLTESLKEQPWSLVRIRQPKDRKVPQ